jgi:hypothetical protein
MREWQRVAGNGNGNNDGLTPAERTFVIILFASRSARRSFGPCGRVVTTERAGGGTQDDSNGRGQSAATTTATATGWSGGTQDDNHGNNGSGNSQSQRVWLLSLAVVVTRYP